jgi:hypothetical protein
MIKRIYLILGILLFFGGCLPTPPCPQPIQHSCELEVDVATRRENNRWARYELEISKQVPDILGKVNRNELSTEAGFIKLALLLTKIGDANYP